MGLSIEGRFFFFEKKKQKTFICFGRHRPTPGGPAAAGNRQKFFASFFQKRSSSFLPYAPLAAGMGHATILHDKVDLPGRAAQCRAMGSDADEIIGLYQRHGLAWAKDRGDRLFEGAWLDRFRCLMPPGAAVLDLGCGSGRPIARYFIEQGCRVTGVDSAPGMIELCQASFPGHDWRVGDMRRIDLGRTFDGILAWDSFFHLCHEDQRLMFPLFRAHAAAGAALMFTSGTSHGEAIGCLGGEALYHASLATEEYRALLDENGFAVVSHVMEDPGCEGHTVWLARAP